MNRLDSDPSATAECLISRHNCGELGISSIGESTASEAEDEHMVYRIISVLPGLKVSGGQMVSADAEGGAPQ